MLISWVLLGIYVICTVFSPLAGNGEAAGAAVLEGAEQAIGFAISIAGGICLWSAVMELMERCGIAAALSRGLRPVLRRLFPAAAKDKAILAALAENVSANLLGLGNAATPAGVRAAQGMAKLSGGRASNELCLLVVLNTASIQLLPSTIASVRAAAGAASAFDIMPAVWISSAISVTVGLMAAALFKRLWA